MTFYIIILFKQIVINFIQIKKPLLAQTALFKLTRFSPPDSTNVHRQPTCQHIAQTRHCQDCVTCDIFQVNLRVSAIVIVIVTLVLVSLGVSLIAIFARPSAAPDSNIPSIIIANLLEIQLQMYIQIKNFCLIRITRPVI